MKIANISSCSMPCVHCKQLAFNVRLQIRYIMPSINDLIAVEHCRLINHPFMERLNRYGQAILVMLNRNDAIYRSIRKGYDLLSLCFDVLWQMTKYMLLQLCSA